MVTTKNDEVFDETKVRNPSNENFIREKMTVGSRDQTVDMCRSSYCVDKMFKPNQNARSASNSIAKRFGIPSIGDLDQDDSAVMNMREASLPMRSPLNFQTDSISSIIHGTRNVNVMDELHKR